jgi:hypothetical protein
LCGGHDLVPLANQPDSAPVTFGARLHRNASDTRIHVDIRRVGDVS